MISDLPSHSMFQNKLAITCVQNILEIIIFGVNRGRGQKSISLDFVKMFKTRFRMHGHFTISFYCSAVQGLQVINIVFSVFRNKPYI